MNAKELAEIAQANKVIEQPIKMNDFFTILSKGSYAKVESLINKFTELANLGFGGVEIGLDGTAEMFGTDEGTGCFYSESEVIQILNGLGFKIDEVNDHFDARDYEIIWDKTLPISKDEIPYKI